MRTSAMKSECLKTLRRGMGRTNATYRNMIDGIRSEYEDFRRALRKQHKPAFDKLWEHAHETANAGHIMNPANPWKALVISITRGIQDEVMSLEERIDELEVEVNKKS